MAAKRAAVIPLSYQPEGCPNGRNTKKQLVLSVVSISSGISFKSSFCANFQQYNNGAAAMITFISRARLATMVMV